MSTVRDNIETVDVWYVEFVMEGGHHMTGKTYDPKQAAELECDTMPRRWISMPAAAKESGTTRINMKHVVALTVRKSYEPVMS